MNLKFLMKLLIATIFMVNSSVMEAQQPSAEEMKMAIEQMRATGMSEEQIAQIMQSFEMVESMEKSMQSNQPSLPGPASTDAPPEKGQAFVDVDGSRFEFRIVECKKENGWLKIKAEQTNGTNQGVLEVQKGQSTVGLTQRIHLKLIRPNLHWTSSRAKFDFNGQKLNWNGNTFNSKKSKDVPMHVQIHCAQRLEEEKIATNLAPEAGKLNISMAEQISSFEILQCKTGVQTEIYAVGAFRDEPAIAVLTKFGNFQHLELWLTEMMPSEKGLSKEDFFKKRDAEYQAWHTPRFKAIQEKYQVTDDMSLDEMNTTMEQQQQAFDVLQEEADEKEMPRTIVHGLIEVDVENNVARFKAPEIIYGGRGRTPDAFFDIEGQKVSLLAQCN